MIKKYISVFVYNKPGYDLAKCGIVTEAETKEEAKEKAIKYIDKTKTKHGIKEYKHIKTILKNSLRENVYCVISI